MRSLISASVLALTLTALTACSGGDDDPGAPGDGNGEAAGETFDASGTVALIGAADSQVDSEDGAVTGDPCEGVGLLDAFSAGDGVVVLDAAGTEVATGELADGVQPEISRQLLRSGYKLCDLAFTVTGIPVTDETLTVRIDKAEATFTQDEADAIVLEVDGDTY